MADAQVEQVAKGLTKAQRRTLLAGRPPSGAGKWPLQNALIEKGLAQYFPFAFTPLGLAVRDYLKEQGNG